MIFFYLFILLVCLFFAIFSWKDWEKAVIIFPLLFPAYLIQINLGAPFNLMELFVYILFIIFLIQQGSKIDWRKIIQQKIFWAAGLLALVATISLFFTPKISFMVTGETISSLKIALGIWKGWIITPLLYFFLLMNLDKKKKNFPLAFDILAVSGVYLSLITIAQVILKQFATSDARASGPFSSANYLSLYLAPIFVYLMIRFHEEVVDHSWIKRLHTVLKKIFRRTSDEELKYFYWICLPIVGIALFFSKSYAAWIAVIIGFLFYYFLHPKKSEIEKIIGFFAIIVLFLGIVSTQINSGKFQQFIDVQGKSSSSVRFEVWRIASKLIKENPFLGIGIGKFPQMYNSNAVKILGKAPLEWEMLHPHNLFLAFWLNLGVIGLLAFLWILFIIFKKAYQSDLSDKTNNLLLISLTMLIVILIHGLFDTPFWKNDLAMQFWLVVAGAMWREN